MNLTELVYLSVASHRITSIVTTESGPLNSFLKLRRYLGRQATIEDKYLEIRQSVAELFSCPYCLGVWVAGILYLLQSPLKPVIYIFTISGIQAILHTLHERLRGVI